ncbi:hypothetical protein D9611_015053 [Ephemerocybe angulata]|uniref:Uncharacterized protein n=1 Tax=Ephemerocybe angulata TaxID=980116 RepID=A0A8H5B6T1_9AGAR|nr:hypothetical protein D9611_015053 [Tulosesus angulatus]
MAPVLPSSLSPHVCILPSPDLSELLEASALPPLQHILQSFSPLPQVTTRTTSLISVPHSSFALRFSDLHEVEEACREPEEQRALRSLDWMTSRINKRCEQWVREMEERGERELSRVPHEDRLRTPWWDELRRCAEGDFVPDRVEGWNHPVAVILAVSTTAPNPLQAITALYSRVLQFPPWVDTNVLRYVLIVHPQDSQFSDEEANALFNAVKKQYGLNCYLLSLELPSPPPAPIPVPALLPRLPPPSGLQSPESTRWQPPATPNTPGHHNSAFALNTLRMDEKDIQQTARFTREFLVMSLIPWMEKCVVEWNENYSSTRRLPSRLFSSTRRLFGSPSPSPAPGHSVSSSVSSLPGRSMTTGSMNGGAPTPPSQLRRLAEFATILGDFKLAASVWESLRKESKGGSDMLPLMSAPSPALQLHASNALLSLHPSAVELPPHAQIRALLYAARWEVGIDPRDFVSNALEGERWFVWAAGNVGTYLDEWNVTDRIDKAEEAPAALLLAHAALLTSMRKNSYRRAAFWYVTAANRLEKCGIKPLTIYFLRKAHELFQIRPPKELSPSFWDSENKSESKSEEFVDVRSGVEYPLARLLYTSGRVTEAVQMFLEILRGAPYPTLQPPTLTTLLELEDPHGFPSEDKTFLDDFRVAFAHLQSTEPEKIDSLNLTVPFKFCQPKRCKVRYPGDDRVSASPIWESCEEDWNTYQKTSGNKQPLAIDRKVCANELFWVDVTLNNPLTAEVNLGNVTLLVERRGGQEEEESFVDIEVIQEVTLRPRETRTVSILLDLKSIVRSASHADSNITEVQPSILNHHIRRRNTGVETVVLNSGSNPVEEVWVVTGNDQEIWIGTKEEELTTSSRTEIVHSRNSLRPTEPQRIPLAQPLQPNEGVTVPISLHGGRTGTHNLYFFITYRESESAPFHSARLERSFEVEPLLDVQVSALPSSSSNYSFVVNVETTSLSQSSLLNITQISTISPLWKLAPIANSEAYESRPIPTGRFSSAAEQWLDGEGKKESLEFVLKKLDDVLQGNFITLSDPPELDLICSHLFETKIRIRSVESSASPYTSPVASTHLPLYNPASVDVAVFWEIPSQGRQGYTTIYGTRIGAAHAPLNDIIDKSENTKVKRSMYAETQREKLELVEGIRNSEWNAEMDPISVSVEDVSEIDHDFSKGPLHVPLKFMVRNHSPLFDTQVTLRLRSRQGPAVYPQHTPTPFPAPYSGKLTFRTTISASEATVLQARVLISRPGIYHIGGWAVESEVLVETGEVTAAEGRGETRKRFRYMQEHPPNSEASIIVRGPRRTSS